MISWLLDVADSIILLSVVICLFVVAICLWPFAALGSETAFNAMGHTLEMMKFTGSKIDNIKRKYK